MTQTAKNSVWDPRAGIIEIVEQGCIGSHSSHDAFHIFEGRTLDVQAGLQDRDRSRDPRTRHVRLCLLGAPFAHGGVGGHQGVHTLTKVVSDYGPPA